MAWTGNGKAKTHKVTDKLARALDSMLVLFTNKKRWILADPRDG